jgi:hypothetical protein
MNSETKKGARKMTINELEKIIADKGFTVAAGNSWEDDFHAYAFSAESLGPATYGHPACTAHYNKETDVLDVTTY